LHFDAVERDLACEGFAESLKRSTVLGPDPPEMRQRISEATSQMMVSAFDSKAYRTTWPK